MISVIVRSKNIYSNLGYHAPDRKIEVNDIYEARDYINKQLELCKIGDNKWREAEQNFDSRSIYLTDGHNIIWFEMVEE